MIIVEKTFSNSGFEVRVIKRKPSVSVKRELSIFDNTSVYSKIEFNDGRPDIYGSVRYVGDDELALEKAVPQFIRLYEDNKNVNKKVKRITVSVLPQEEWDI